MTNPPPADAGQGMGVPPSGSGHSAEPEPVPVSAASAVSVPNARDLPLAKCCQPGGPCFEAGLAWARHGHDWQTASAHGLEIAIAAFKAALPGYWFTVGECQVSADASCGPTRESPDIALIPKDRRFDDGFHADLPQPATMADALVNVLAQAMSARQGQDRNGLGAKPASAVAESDAP